VADDGRGMPVDIHPKEKVSGVELILTRLHAGGKFSDNTYSSPAACTASACRSSMRCRSSSSAGCGAAARNTTSLQERQGRLEARGRRHGRQRNTGTTVRFWPDPKYFDSPEVLAAALRHVLKAKAVLCPGLRVRFDERGHRREGEWQYTGGLEQYLRERSARSSGCPMSPSSGSRKGDGRRRVGAIVWAPTVAAPSPKATST
jgi:topoisomerase IV subunit B